MTTGQVSSGGEQPFTTSNAILAYCLHLAGVPWEDDRKAATVFYSREIIDKFRNGNGEPFYKGWELEKAVEHAFNAGKRGHVEYAFKHTDRLDILLAAFRQQSDQLETAEGDMRDVITDRIIEFQDNELAAKDVLVIRLACVMLKMRVEFMDAWMARSPRVILKNPGKVTRTTGVIETKHGLREARIVDTPGFKVVSLNASKETREKLGV